MDTRDKKDEVLENGTANCDLKKVNQDGNEELKKEEKDQIKVSTKIENDTNEKKSNINGYTVDEEKINHENDESRKNAELDISIDDLREELFKADSSNPIEIELNITHDKEGNEFCVVSPSGLNVVELNSESEDKELSKDDPSNSNEVAARENECKGPPINAKLKRTKLSLNIIPHGKSYSIKKTETNDANVEINQSKNKYEGKISEEYISHQVSIVRPGEEFASDGPSKEIQTELSNHEVNHYSEKHVKTGGSKQDIEMEEITDGFVIVELDPKQDGSVISNSAISKSQKKAKVELVGWDKFRSILLITIIILLIIWIILLVYFSYNYDI